MWELSPAEGPEDWFKVTARALLLVGRTCPLHRFRCLHTSWVEIRAAFAQTPSVLLHLLVSSCEPADGGDEAPAQPLSPRETSARWPPSSAQDYVCGPIQVTSF